MSKKPYSLSIYERWSWERAFGPTPRYKVRHDTIASACAEAERLARLLRARGDGRAAVLVFGSGPDPIGVIR
jgi:hypothetical protein